MPSIFTLTVITPGKNKTFKWNNTSGGTSGGGEDDVLLNDDDINNLLDDKAPGKTDQGKNSLVGDINILLEDRVSDFKKKIFVATDIPIYRQHVWYETKGTVNPIGYSASIDNEPLHINVHDLKKSDTIHENIPVDMTWYTEKDDIQITALDDTQLMGDLVGVRNYFMLDLGIYIEPIKGDIESFIAHDTYSFELIYYGFVLKYWPMLSISAFGEYIQNENGLINIYPLIARPRHDLQNMYILETKIYKESLKSKIPIRTGITYSIVGVRDTQTRTQTRIHLRNLLDLFVLSDDVPFMYGNIVINNRSFRVRKSYRGYASKSFNVMRNTGSGIILVISIDKKYVIHFIIQDNGTYRTMAHWPEDLVYGFDDIRSIIIKHVNPIIQKINSLGCIVLNKPIVLLNASNLYFINTNINLFWILTTTNAKTQLVTDDFVKANIFKKTERGYLFKKGVSLEPIISFNHLLDISANAAYNVRLIDTNAYVIFETRFSDIRVIVQNISENEYKTFYIYIIKLLSRIQADTQINSNTRKLVQLKESDPNLYSFKKIYQSPIIYAKICQSQKQPDIHNMNGKNRIKYWNFTTNRPAYYSCNNKKYPYLGFVTGKHPKGYCIPCCYKTSPLGTGGVKNSIYQQCLDTKIFKKIEKTSASRYIIQYGKDIEVGRLSMVPGTIATLLQDTLGARVADYKSECIRDKGYYIFGVVQNIASVSDVGSLFTISHALGMDIISFIEQSIEKIKARPIIWNSLFQGRILSYFKTVDDFILELHSVFIGNIHSTFYDWSTLFIDLVELYWDIKIIHFTDNGQVCLKIPPGVVRREDYIKSSRCIIILEKKSLFYPIYVINKDMFFGDGKIHMRVFDSTSETIYAITSMFKATEKPINGIDLFTMKAFAKVSKEYTLTQLIINANNFCYGVIFETKQSQSFFIPIRNSKYGNDNIPISFDYDFQLLSWEGMVLFMKDINKYLLQYRLEIKNEIWITFSKKIIGFKYQDLYYWIQPMEMQEDTKRIELLYDPHIVNKAINRQDKPIVDTREAKLPQSLYTTHLRSLVIIELARYLKKNKNTFKGLDQPAIFTKLQQIFKTLTIDKEPSLISFPNLMTSCILNDALYCTKNKLMVTNKKLFDILERLSFDILNPYLSKNLLKSADIIDNFKFISRKNEHIVIC